MLMKLPVISNHVEFLLHGNVAKGLLDLIVASKEDDTLLSTEEGELVLAGFI